MITEATAAALGRLAAPLAPLFFGLVLLLVVFGLPAALYLWEPIALLPLVWLLTGFLWSAYAEV